MDLVVKFVPSAFKHGISEQDIRHAYKTRIYARQMEGYDNKYGFIGFNRAGNPMMAMRPGVLEQLRG